ncbi:MAG TPA: S8/S53 family peptidase [Ignavibacteria bacterium]|nr:S8/S53 family peptidase [Ignavibacteria bacterium]
MNLLLDKIKNRKVLAFCTALVVIIFFSFLYGFYIPGKSITAFYYYKNEPQRLNIRTDKIFIKTRGLQTPEGLTSVLRSYAEIAPITDIDRNEKRHFINLKTPVTESALKNLIASINRNEEIEYSSPVYSPQNGGGNTVLQGLIDEILVQFKPHLSEGVINDYLNNAGFAVRQTLELSGGKSYVLKIQDNKKLLSIDAANSLYESGMVNWSEPNFYFSGLLCFTPNDQYFPLQWAIRNTGGNIPGGVIGTAGSDTRVDSAWNLTTGTPQCIICIVDTGIDTTHPDLKSNLLVSKGYDFINEHPYPMDDHGHGTVTAGLTAAGQNNEIGISGIAPGCKLVAVKIFNSSAGTTSSAMINGIIYSYQQGWVSSNSWGLSAGVSAVDQAIEDGVSFGRNGKGTVFCFATGNYNSGMQWPSTNPNVIAVGGLDPCNSRKSPLSCDAETWWGANYGNKLSVVAPSVKIYSTTLNGGYFDQISGTSVATPICAGVCALSLSWDSTQRWDTVRIRLCNTADKAGKYTYNGIGPYTVLGYSWHNEMGYGKINAYKLLKYVKKLHEPKIIHSPLGNTEQSAGTRPVNCSIIPAHSGVNPLLTKLLYAKNGVNWSVTALTYAGNNNWTANLPLSGDGIYNYYITTTDSLNKTSTAPDEAPANYYSFISSVDTLKPVIVCYPLQNIPKVHWPVKVGAKVTDNTELDSVWVSWYINNTASGIKHLKLNRADENNYFSVFNSLNSDVKIGDSVFYKIFARDFSSNHNIDSSTLCKIVITDVSNICLGNGHDFSTYPFHTETSNSRVQMIYRASEFQNVTAGGNSIVRIGFYVTSCVYQSLNDMSVRFQHTSLGALREMTNSGWATAFSGTCTITDTGWKYLDMTPPYFNYDGINNLMIEICSNNDSTNSVPTVVRGSVNSSIIPCPISSARNGSDAGCYLQAVTYQGIRPDICFVMADIPVVNNVITINTPRQFSLKQNYPNPFNPVTKIDYEIPKQSLVVLKVYDVTGREIRTLVNEIKPSGKYSVDFNGADLSSGIYFLRFESGGQVDVKKMVLLK